MRGRGGEVRGRWSCKEPFSVRASFVFVLASSSEVRPLRGAMLSVVSNVLQQLHDSENANSEEDAGDEIKDDAILPDEERVALLEKFHLLEHQGSLGLSIFYFQYATYS